LFIRVYTGQVPRADLAVFREVMCRKKRKREGQKCGGKIGKSAGQKRLRELYGKEKERRAYSESIELRQLISELSEYLLFLQARLSKSPGPSTG
jgi:hypothetical protein